MLLHSLIEEWPSEAGVFIHELPGMYAGASNVTAALDILPEAVEVHLAWLASHGFVEGSDSGIEIAVAEHLPAIDGRYGPLFEHDRQVATAQSIQHALSVADLARRDIVDLYRSVSAHRRQLQPAPDAWSIARHLQHIAETEVFYVDALTGPSGLLFPDDPVQALRVSAAHVRNTMQELDGQMRGSSVRQRGEEWTATKVLRRMTAHLREHYPWLQDLVRG